MSRRGSDNVADGRPLEVLWEETCARSPAYRNLLVRLARFARCDQPIVLEGERGTGKTYLARHIHRLSRRAGGMFSELSLAAMDDALAASALFGHIVGAFTDARQARQGHFIACKGGTLFLDEIGRASLKIQGMLLRAIEGGEIWPLGADRPVRSDVRIVAASNTSLAQLVERQVFLPDLCDRLGSFYLRVPPLRERAEDIPALAEGFVAHHASECGYRDAPPAIHHDLTSALQGAPWPGNVRQLRGTMIRIMVDACGAPQLMLAHCQDDLAYLRDQRRSQGIDADAVRRAVAESGSKAAASRLLGVSRTTVYSLLNGSGASGK